MSAHLYELSEEILNAQRMYEEAETDEEKAEALALLDAIGGDINAKLEATARMVRNWEHEADEKEAQARVWEQASQKMKQNAQALRNRAAGLLNGYIAHNLQSAGLIDADQKKKYQAGQFTFRLRTMPEHVVIDKPGSIAPSCYDEAPLILRLDRVKALLKETPVDWAHLERDKPQLEIK